MSARSAGPPRLRAKSSAAARSRPRALAVASTSPLTGSMRSVSTPSPGIQRPPRKLSSRSGDVLIGVPPREVELYCGLLTGQWYETGNGRYAGRIVRIVLCRQHRDADQEGHMQPRRTTHTMLMLCAIALALATAP